MLRRLVHAFAVSTIFLLLDVNVLVGLARALTFAIGLASSLRKARQCESLSRRRRRRSLALLPLILTV